MNTPITLYARDVSGYCCKVRIALAHKAIAYTDAEPPDGYGSPAYRAIVPAGTIPGLVEGDLVLSESEAIVEYLNERVPDPAMLPGDAVARARLRQLSRFHDTRLEPPLRTLFAHVTPAARDMAVVETQLKLFEARLAELAALATPAPLLAGAALSLADLGYPATFMLARGMAAAFGRGLAMPETLVAYEAALTAHPSVAPALARCRAATDAWFAMKLAA
jgi:glutathione S-transferase